MYRNDSIIEKLYFNRSYFLGNDLLYHMTEEFLNYIFAIFGDPWWKEYRESKETWFQRLFRKRKK